MDVLLSFGCVKSQSSDYWLIHFKHCGLTVAAADTSEDMLKSVSSEMNHLQEPFFKLSIA